MEVASPPEPSGMDKLSDDLLSNILIRLPAKLLAQMRCVSKSLNAFLTRPSFIKSHLNRSNLNGDEIILVFNTGTYFGREPFTAHGSQSPEHELTNFIKFPFDFPSSFPGGVIGSVNGLICLYIEDAIPVIHIWNPSLSAVITLPPHAILPPDDFDMEFCIRFRFGYDPKTDDYKVVKLTGCCGLRFAYNPFVFKWLQVEIYSMRKGSWEFITEGVPMNVSKLIEQAEVCVDGHDGRIHWLANIDEKHDQQIILAFDLGVETFTMIPLPNITGKRDNVIGIFAEKLCLISSSSNSDCECELWVMERYGFADSWVNEHVFTPLFHIFPFGFTLKNQFFFEIHNKLVLSKNYKSVGKPVKSMPFWRARTKVVVYVDSLVWVTPTKRVLTSVAM